MSGRDTAGGREMLGVDRKCRGGVQMLQLVVWEKLSRTEHRTLATWVTMVRCCVLDCTNDTRDKKGWSFFRFPSDKELLQTCLTKIDRLAFVPAQEAACARSTSKIRDRALRETWRASFSRNCRRVPLAGDVRGD